MISIASGRLGSPAYRTRMLGPVDIERICSLVLLPVGTFGGHMLHPLHRLPLRAIDPIVTVSDLLNCGLLRVFLL